MKAALFAGLAVFVLRGRLMSGGRESRVAAAAPASLGHYESITRGGKVVKLFAGGEIVKTTVPTGVARSTEWPS